MRVRVLAAGLALLGLGALMASCSDSTSVQQPTAASVVVTPTAIAVEAGETTQLSATVLDETGAPMSRRVNWASSDPGIAKIDANGVVTGVAKGVATITASCDQQTATVTLTVTARLSALALSGLSSEPLAVGGTLQLGAVATDVDGNVFPITVAWSSSDPAIATVDAAGVVTGVAKGSVTITGDAGRLSASTSIQVTGTVVVEEAGNNLSYPVVFAEGYGITALPLTTSAAGDTATGIRPLTTEGITVDSLPFFYSGNVPDYNGTYYLQQSVNTWQAQWTNRAGSGMVSAQVDWGDNLVGHTWNTGSKIRIEIGLYDYTGPQLQGYNMTVLYGTGETEMQGTDGSKASFVPLIYAVTPRLIMQKLSGEGGDVVATVADLPATGSIGTDAATMKFGAEVNVGGKLVYGYNFDVATLAGNAGVPADGWWRVTFQLDPSVDINGVTVSRNVSLDELILTGEELYAPKLSSSTASTVDFYVEPK